jgi:hypothetical protein
MSQPLWQSKAIVSKNWVYLDQVMWMSAGNFNLVTVQTSRYKKIHNNVLLHCYMVYYVQDYLFSRIVNCSLYLQIQKISDLSQTWYISGINRIGADSLTQVSPLVRLSVRPNPEAQTRSVESSQLRRCFPTFLPEYVWEKITFHLCAVLVCFLFSEKKVVKKSKKISNLN